jgi:antitoxin component YwqK of YwqJK toxin-antitoxin module
MKKIILLICATVHLALSAQRQIIDTSYHNNGKISMLVEFDTVMNSFCGLYQEFNEQGIMTMDGCYRLVDSIACKDCYTCAEYENMEKQNFINCKELRVGVWKYYHPLGQLKSIGSYGEIIRFYIGTSYPKTVYKNGMWGGPVNSYIHFEYLKNGTWENYDEQGNNISSEKFLNGDLVYIEERGF